MNELLTPSNTLFVLALLTILFQVYKYFRDPQTANDKKDALLGQQLKSSSESVDMRFKTMQDNFSALLLQSNNHIHTVDTKVDVLVSTISQLGKDVVKLSTIIEERMPRK